MANSLFLGYYAGLIGSSMFFGRTLAWYVNSMHRIN